jgi:hypothetical protein
MSTPNKTPAYAENPQARSYPLRPVSTRFSFIVPLLLILLSACSCRTDDESLVPCVLEEPAFVDWMAPGPHAAGRMLYNGTTIVGEAELAVEIQVTYPATEDAQDALLAEGGPWPVIWFEHAYGADFLNSDWLLDLLASRGFVVFSAAHNGAWDGAGDWWGDHAALFQATVDLGHAWQDDPDSPFHGALALDKTALMGHSHGGGAALHVMDQLDDVLAVVLITVRPNLDGNYYLYHEYYDGMPPMLNVVGSRDEDGTTAYGTSIGVYEALTRPRFMVTVEGASHYTFTDEASIAPSSITREAGQVSGGSGIVAFLEYLLHDDERGLHSLRGDVPLFDDSGAPVRIQSHPEGETVIDDFEALIPAQGSGIVGIPDQTYVNGFMGDTFSSFEDGVDLLVAEIEDLSNTGDTVLFYQDASRGEDAYAEALSRIDRDVTSVTIDTEFATALADDWDLVVATQQDGNTSDTRPFDAVLADWICDGGRAILSDFRWTSATAAETYACAGAAFDGTTNWTMMTSAGALFDGELRMQNPGWGTYTVGLWTTNTVFATMDLTSTGVPDPTVGPLGSVTATDLDLFEETSALDTARALMMPTQALEVAWTQLGQVRWDFTVPLTAMTEEVLTLRMLQVHDDVNNKGVISLTVVLEDSTGGTDSAVVTVGETLDWLETTVPKSVFETTRLPLQDFSGIDVTSLSAVSLVFDGSESGRLLIDDLELTPGLACQPSAR